MKKLTILTAIAVITLVSVNTTLKAQDKDGEFKPSGNLWGYVFGDYAYKTHNDTLQRGGGAVQYKGFNSLNSGNTSANTNAPALVQTNAFQIRRMYLGYDYQFAKNFSAKIVLANEQNYDASGLALVTSTTPNTLTTTGGKNTVYLKYANVKWMNIFKGSDLVIGQYETNSFAIAGNTEQAWAYRSIERTIMDLHNTDASSDLGISLQGKVKLQHAEDSLKPMYLGYSAQVGNGNSASAETDIFKKYRGNVYVSFLKQSVLIGLYADYVQTQFSPYHTSNMTFKAYAAYKNDWLRVGVEAFQQTNQNSTIYTVTNNGVIPAGTKPDTASGVQFGWSVFASGTILKSKKTNQAMLSIFARYDSYNPDTKWNSNNLYSSVYSGIKGSNVTTATFYKQTFITAGLDWCPNPRVHIMPNIWYNGYKTDMTTTGVGGTGTDLSSRVKKDNDMVYRLTFYFVFNGLKKVANSGMNY